MFLRVYNFAFEIKRKESKEEWIFKFTQQRKKVNLVFQN